MIIHIRVILHHSSKNNADTTYGTADDIYDIDDYTKAVLTYTGTYVSADGKIYLKSSKVTNASSVIQ